MLASSMDVRLDIYSIFVFTSDISLQRMILTSTTSTLRTMLRLALEGTQK